MLQRFQEILLLDSVRAKQGTASGTGFAHMTYLAGAALKVKAAAAGAGAAPKEAAATAGACSAIDETAVEKARGTRGGRARTRSCEWSAATAAEAALVVARRDLGTAAVW